MEIKAGTIVFSKAGRDKGSILLVLKTEEKYVFVADGELRRVEKPKKKKIIHLQATNYTGVLNEGITNADVRRIIAQYKPV